MVTLMKQKLLCEKYLNGMQDYSSTWIVKAKAAAEHRVPLKPPDVYWTFARSKPSHLGSFQCLREPRTHTTRNANISLIGSPIEAYWIGGYRMRFNFQKTHTEKEKKPGSDENENVIWEICFLFLLCLLRFSRTYRFAPLLFYYLVWLDLFVCFVCLFLDCLRRHICLCHRPAPARKRANEKNDRALIASPPLDSGVVTMCALLFGQETKKWLLNALWRFN